MPAGLHSEQSDPGPVHLPEAGPEPGHATELMGGMFLSAVRSLDRAMVLAAVRPLDRVMVLAAVGV